MINLRMASQLTIIYSLSVFGAHEIQKPKVEYLIHQKSLVPQSNPATGEHLYKYK